MVSFKVVMASWGYSTVNARQMAQWFSAEGVCLPGEGNVGNIVLIVITREGTISIYRVVARGAAQHPTVQYPTTRKYSANSAEAEKLCFNCVCIINCT